MSAVSVRMKTVANEVDDEFRGRGLDLKFDLETLEANRAAALEGATKETEKQIRHDFDLQEINLRRQMAKLEGDRKSALEKAQLRLQDELNSKAGSETLGQGSENGSRLPLDDIPSDPA